MTVAPIPASTVALYRRYNGDADGLSRSADRTADVSGADWRDIDDLRQRAFIVATGRGSESFCQSFEADLSARMPDNAARREFDRVVEADLQGPSAHG